MRNILRGGLLYDTIEKYISQIYCTHNSISFPEKLKRLIKKAGIGEIGF